MAAEKDKVMEMVEAELARDPGIALDVLYERAREIDPAIAQLSRRQFHARYPLQVKRRASAAAGGNRSKEEGAGSAAPPAPRGRRKQAERPARRGRAAQAASAAAPEVDRAAIRAALLSFAEAVAKAEDAAQLVKVVGNVDQYVDRIVRAAGASA